MGRYNFSAQKVHAQATHLLQLGKLTAPPPWYSVVGSIPSSEVLTRRPMQKKYTRSRKASRLFKPVQLEHQEDKLRWEFFNDHPWELARPRVVVEDDGRDSQRWDWGHALCRPKGQRGDVKSMAEVEAWEARQEHQAARPLNGESVVQRQQWLMNNTGLSQDAAYDKARKEFYTARHAQEIEERVAKEEAIFYGGEFGMNALEIGMELEDKAYEHWRAWAAKEIANAKQRASSAYTGQESSEIVQENDEQLVEEEIESTPASNPA